MQMKNTTRTVICPIFNNPCTVYIDYIVTDEGTLHLYRSNGCDNLHGSETCSNCISSTAEEFHQTWNPGDIF